MNLCQPMCQIQPQGEKLRKHSCRTIWMICHQRGTPCKNNCAGPFGRYGPKKEPVQKFMSSHMADIDPRVDPLQNETIWTMWKILSQGVTLTNISIIPCFIYTPKEKSLVKLSIIQYVIYCPKGKPLVKLYVSRGDPFQKQLSDHVSSLAWRWDPLKNLCHPMWKLRYQRVTLCKIYIGTCGSYEPKWYPLKNLCRPIWQVWLKRVTSWKIFGRQFVSYVPKGDTFEKYVSPFGINFPKEEPLKMSVVLCGSNILKG